MSFAKEVRNTNILPVLTFDDDELVSAIVCSSVEFEGKFRPLPSAVTLAFMKGGECREMKYVPLSNSAIGSKVDFINRMIASLDREEMGKISNGEWTFRELLDELIDARLK